MATKSKTYGVEDLKKLYGIKTDDEENPLENYLGKSSFNQANSIENQRESAKQQASINNELMMKYLPESIKYSGMGTSASGQQMMLEQNNNYMKNLSEIDANYNAKQDSIYQNYLETSKQEADSKQAEWYNQLTANYGTKWAQEVNEEGKLTDDLYNKYLEEINSNENIDQHQKDLLVSNLDNYRMSDEQSKNYRNTTDAIKNYGINKNATAIKANEFNLDTLNALGIQFKGSGNGKKQDGLVNKIENAYKNGLLRDGDIIDINYGKGKYCLLYYKGQFYSTTRKSNTDIDSILDRQ